MTPPQLQSTEFIGIGKSLCEESRVALASVQVTVEVNYG